jgi:hypothetical protein
MDSKTSPLPKVVSLLGGWTWNKQEESATTQVLSFCQGCFCILDMEDEY